MTALSTIARLERQSMPVPEAGCHLWIGATSASGYGRVSFHGKNRLAHRVMWQLTNGPIPGGLVVCHKCDTPACINPLHLFLGTNADNNSDAMRKGRLRRTPTRWNLTPDAIREIRRLAATTTRPQLAATYGVSKAVIQDIASGRNWSHIE